MEEHLFSYGTLQQEPVQLATFGRKLAGTAEILEGFRIDMIRIEDESVIAKSGQQYHPVIIHTGNREDTVNGTVFKITNAELLQADDYEVDEYKRIKVSLKSGNSAWVYIKADTDL
jgi:gamma-glutamylcyclotransferase (GGCT)/AIG2-like uncharacterized protein YtfP